MHISSEGRGLCLADLAREHLVDRDAGFDVLAFGALRMRGAQVHGCRARMIAGAFLGRERRGHAVIGAADDRDAVLERRDRLQDARQLPALAGAGRPPVARRRAVRHVQEAVAAVRRRRLCHRGHHRIEQRQSDRRAHSAQEGSAWQVSLGDEHRDALPSSISAQWASATTSVAAGVSSAARI